MALKSNVTFAGSPIYDVDPGALTRARVFENAQGDIAGALKALTDNRRAKPIDHTGPGRGSLLGVPLVNQHLSRSLLLGTTGAKNGGADGNGQRFPYLVQVPPGETTVIVEVTMLVVVDMLPRVRLTDSASDAVAVSTSGIELPLIATAPVVAGEMTLFRARFDGVSSGLAVATVIVDSEFAVSTRSGVRTSNTLGSVVMRSARRPRPKMVVEGSDENPAPTQVPAASEALFFQQMDQTLFAAGHAITGWHASRIDANINGLYEYATAKPAFENRFHTHNESVLRGPARDRFSAFTRRTFTFEPIPIIPIASLNFGGIKSDGGYLVDPSSPASVDDRKAYAPYPLTAALTESGTVVCQIPDLPAGVVRWAVLVGQSSGVGFADVRVQAQLGSNASSAAVTPTVVTGSPTALATGVALAFTRDSTGNRLRIFLEWVGAGGGPLDYCLLAAAVWVEE